MMTAAAAAAATKTQYITPLKRSHQRKIVSVLKNQSDS